jgi:hypothetical protein
VVEVSEVVGERRRRLGEDGERGMAADDAIEGKKGRYDVGMQVELGRQGIGEPGDGGEGIGGAPAGSTRTEG